MRRDVAYLALAAAWVIVQAAPTSAGDLGRVPSADRRNPPAWRALNAAEAKLFELGQAVFNTPFVLSGTPGAGRIDGLGPFFANASCDGCHNNGARGRGPIEAGSAPPQLVIQLGRTDAAEDHGDARYGRVLSPSAVTGLQAEGRIAITYAIIKGRFRDGSSWEIRQPSYRPVSLAYGPLDGGTVIKPRLAPALFGVGLIEEVPGAAIEELADPDDRDGNGIRGRVSMVGSAGQRSVGRFGWQGTMASLRAQTARAFVLEQGIISVDEPFTDCTQAEPACRHAQDGGIAEVSEDLLQAVVTFQALLAVPMTAGGNDSDWEVSETFEKIGCAQCHRPHLPVQLPGAMNGSIGAYTDLLLHDLGEGLADRDPDGRAVRSLWRTAPLWGLNVALGDADRVALLHDGRARSIVEAILWHDGEGQAARDRFSQLPSEERNALVAWLSKR